MARDVAVINLERLADWDPGVEITPETLRDLGLLRAIPDNVKILGDDGGKALPSGLRFRDVFFSKRAREALAAAGAQFGDDSPES